MLSLEHITPLIEAKLGELGLELFDIRFFQAGKRSVLRITVDSPEGVKISDCERASQELTILLDVENFSSGRPYNLEVSSPGIDRPLIRERDYRRIKGRYVVLHLQKEVLGKKTIKGKVIECEDNKVLVQIEDNRLVEISLCDIYSGREEIRFK